MRRDTTIRTSPSRGSASAEVTGFYDEATGSIQYVVSDAASGQSAIIDPVRDFEPRCARTGSEAAEAILDHVEARGLTVAWILDTHPHADHLSAAHFLKERLGAPIATGEKVRDIARMWAEFYNQPAAFDPAADFDRLFDDGESFVIGGLTGRVMLSPGHTLGSVTYLIGADAAFVHDTLMQPDSGTSRADFPGGDAAALYHSIQRILALPDATRLFVGHDYRPNGRPAAWESSVAEQREGNIHLAGGVSEAKFVQARRARDAELPLPDRMLHALQVNLRGGRLPEPEADGRSYFKIPADRF